MQPQSDTEYKALLTDVIKKQIIILGPDITLAKARNVPGLVVDQQGNVTDISGEPQNITQALIDQFVQLSGMIVKKTMEPLLAYHPGAEASIPQVPVITPMPNSPVPMSKTEPPTPVTSIPTPTPNPSVNPSAGATPTPVQSVSPPMVTPIEHPTLDDNDQTQKAINEALKQI